MIPAKTIAEKLLLLTVEELLGTKISVLCFSGRLSPPSRLHTAHSHTL
jgi:hypothetical protein